jgi:hypothetical protein
MGPARSPEPDQRRAIVVTMSVSVPAPAAALATAGLERGLRSRVVAAVAHGSAGILLVSTVLGLAIAAGIVSRGVVVAGASDVAFLQALAPLALIFAIVGIGHVGAGLGILFGSRNAAGLGIGLGLLDLVAGVVMLALGAGAKGSAFDASAFAMAFVVGGIVLAVSARAADWNTHGPLAEG